MKPSYRRLWLINPLSHLWYSLTSSRKLTTQPKHVLGHICTVLGTRSVSQVPSCDRLIDPMHTISCVRGPEPRWSMGDVVKIKCPGMCLQTFITLEYFCGLHGLTSRSLPEHFMGIWVWCCRKNVVLTSCVDLMCWASCCFYSWCDSDWQMISKVRHQGLACLWRTVLQKVDSACEMCRWHTPQKTLFDISLSC